MLSAVGSSMIATGRNDVALARNLSASALAQAAADGAVQQAAFHLLPCTGQSGCNPWPTDGSAIDAGRDGIAIAVCLADEGGKVNPNRVNPALMAALLVAVDLPADQASRLAAAIVGWRTAGASPADTATRTALYRQAGLPYAPNGQPFASIDDLRFVLGMTPAILGRLRPNLSIWNQAQPDPALASPITRAALQALLGTDPASLLALGAAIAGAQPRAIAVTATASIPRGAQFTRAAVISLERDPAKPKLKILSWSTAASTPCR